ncbi:hypothetical protein [Granulicella tundricola]|nr:hypothetical protein [Granulicella tundricola]
MTIRRVCVAGVWLAGALGAARGQGYGAGSAPQAPAQVQGSAVDANGTRLETMSKLLMETQRQLEATQQQLNQLRSELEAMRGKEAAVSSGGASSSQGGAVPAGTLAEKVDHQQEELEVLQAEVKQHDQTKLESVSKYPVRVYGLMLFNAYSNAGVVDDADLPSAAIQRTPDLSHGSVGATFRQTLFGLSATGPRVFGARTSADLSVDFFGGSSYSYYATTNGSVRLRRADIRLGWGDRAEDTSVSRDEVHLGIDAPLISPLSPTSYATVAMPALAWSGNLWTWAPQLRYSHRFAISNDHPERNLQVEGGLWDPPVVGYAGSTAGRVLSAGEISRRPGFLGRVSAHGGSSAHPFSFGVGGYSDRQTFYEGQQIQMWAVTSDLQVPISRRFQLEGEIYRGRGLGGLGGGAYKDVLTGLDKVTGEQRSVGLNAVGGWVQWKTHLTGNTEANLMYGQDGGFARDFRTLNLTGSTYALEQSARTQMIVANVIYRPKTYLIFSPEYRRILSWKATGPAANANIYTLSLGYQF